MFTRRAVLLGTLGTSVLGFGASGCAEPKVDSESMLPISGDAKLPGEPLWSAKSNAFLVAPSTEQLSVLHKVGLSYASLGGNGFLALANECPRDQGLVGRIGWCQGSQQFSCSSCNSTWDITGLTVAGSPRGLTYLRADTTAAGDLVVDRSVRIKGVASPSAVSASAQVRSGTCEPFFAVPTRTASS
jgi:hypothetical protein